MKMLKHPGLVFTGLIAIAAFALAFTYATRSHEMLAFDASNPPTTAWSYAALEKGIVHYQLEGPENQPLVVLVHGFSIPAYVWDPTYQALRKQGHRVLRFDLYGRGFSSRPELAYSIQDYVDQLKELLKHLNIIRPVKLVGLSMGGAIVTHYAVANPDQVERIALLAPLVKSPTRLMQYPLLIPGLGKLLAEIAIVPSIRNGLSKAVYQPEVFPDWQEKFEPQTRYQGYSRAIHRSANNLYNQDSTATYRALAELEIPTMLIWGKDDQTLPYADHASLLRLFDSIEFHALEECGHLPHYEHPAVVNARLHAFLS